MENSSPVWGRLKISSDLNNPTTSYPSSVQTGNSKTHYLAGFRFSEVLGSFKEHYAGKPFKMLDFSEQEISLVSESNKSSVLGDTPCKMYCPRCRKYIGTIVYYEVQTVSLWERICCTKDPESASSIIHKCRLCKLGLAKV